MPPLSSLARVTRRDLPDGLDENSLEGQAWLTWSAGLNELRQDPQSATHPEGYITGRIAVASVMRGLWPLASHDEISEMSRPVYEFLRRSNNAKCIDRRTEDPDTGERVKPVWQFSTTWKNVTGIVVTAHRTHEKQTRAEKRLTPEEAGETLPPGEVTIRQADKRLQALEKGRESVRARHKRVMQEVLDLIMLADPQPLAADEIHQWLRNQDNPELGVHSTTVRAIVQDLHRQGKLFSRTETKDERIARYGQMPKARPALLWSARPVVPVRTERDVVGVTKEPAPQSNPGVLREQVESYVEGLSLGESFTISEIAKHLTPGASRTGIRTNLVRLADDGILSVSRPAGKRKTAYHYTKIMELSTHTREEASTHTREEALAPEPVPAPAPAPAPATGLAAQLEEMVEAAVRERLAPLEAENKRLKLKLREIRQVLDRSY